MLFSKRIKKKTGQISKENAISRETQEGQESSR